MGIEPTRGYPQRILSPRGLPPTWRWRHVVAIAFRWAMRDSNPRHPACKAGALPIAGLLSPVGILEASRPWRRGRPPRFHHQSDRQALSSGESCWNFTIGTTKSVTKSAWGPASWISIKAFTWRYALSRSRYQSPGKRCAVRSGLATGTTRILFAIYGDYIRPNCGHGA